MQTVKPRSTEIAILCAKIPISPKGCEPLQYIVDASTFAPAFRDLSGLRKHPFPLTDRITYVGNSLVSSHIIDTGSGLILLDTGFPQTRSLLIQSIWEAGFRPEDICYIVHSHGHVDHIGGTNLVKSFSGAKTVLHEADAAMFRDHPVLSFDADQEFPYSSLFEPDIAVRDGDTLTLGDTTLEFVLTPGHSPGVLSIFFHTEHQGKTYTAAMHGGAGLNTLCREHFRRYAAEGEDMEKSRAAFEAGLLKVLDRPVDIVLGNHPNQNHTFEKRQKQLENPNGPNPFLDSAEWKAYIQSILDSFHKMIADGD